MTDDRSVAPRGEIADLLNSLGIVGPNIRHAEQTEPDPKWSAEELDIYRATRDQRWCVCGRVWPCEADALGQQIAELQAGLLTALRPPFAAAPDELRAALDEWLRTRGANREWSGPAEWTAEDGYMAAVAEVRDIFDHPAYQRVLALRPAGAPEPGERRSWGFPCPCWRRMPLSAPIAIATDESGR